MPVLFSVVLCFLGHVQGHLENPFDQVGEDDVVINPEKFVDSLQGMDEVALYLETPAAR